MSNTGNIGKVSILVIGIVIIGSIFIVTSESDMIIMIHIGIS